MLIIPHMIGTTMQTPGREEVLGVTTCPTCRHPFRILKKHELFISKSIQCPKCHRPFVMQIEAPAPVAKAIDFGLILGQERAKEAAVRLDIVCSSSIQLDLGCK